MVNILYFFSPLSSSEGLQGFHQVELGASIESGQKRAEGDLSLLVLSELFLPWKCSRFTCLIKDMFKTIFQGHLKSSYLMAGPVILVLFQNTLISFSSKQVALITRSWWFGKEWRQ